MPSLTFVAPHWLYWLGLILFPLFAMFATQWQRRRPGPLLSLPVAYFLLLTGGMFGVHRLYLKSRLSLVFIILVLVLLGVNAQARHARDIVSEANNAVSIAHMEIKRAQRYVEKGRRNAAERLAKAQDRLVKARQQQQVAEAGKSQWDTVALGMGGTLLLLLFIDALQLPRLVHARRAVEIDDPGDGFHCPSVEQEHDDNREPFAFNQFISRLNGFCGEFVAYWSVIAVFVYYYEVIARYVFNANILWALETTVFLFAWLVLLGASYCVKVHAHLGVDVRRLFVIGRRRHGAGLYPNDGLGVGGLCGSNHDHRF